MKDTKDTRDTITAKSILFLAANPKGTSPLRLDEEVREIDNGLQRAKRRDQFKLEQKWAVRSRDVRRAMLDINPQIVHFSGHGAEQEGLVFEDRTGHDKLYQIRLNNHTSWREEQREQGSRGRRILLGEPKCGQLPGFDIS